MRTYQAAIAWGFDQIRNPSQDWTRLCLSFVRQAYGIDYPAGWDRRANYADRNAGTAWDRATLKHVTSDAKSIPRGVPVFFETPGEADHIVLSLGLGRCLTNDFKRAGKIDVANIADIAAEWGPLLGWTEDLLGQRVWTPAPPPLPPSLPPVLSARESLRDGKAKAKALGQETRLERIRAALKSLRQIGR